MPHSFWSRVHPRLIACGAVLAIAQPLSAQQPRVIIAGGQGANVVTLSSLALSDTAVRRLIETHLPDAFTDDADAHHVLLVLDANGEYVSGKVSKATVVTPGDREHERRELVRRRRFARRARSGASDGSPTGRRSCRPPELLPRSRSCGATPTAESIHSMA